MWSLGVFLAFGFAYSFVHSSSSASTDGGVCDPDYEQLDDLGESCECLDGFSGLGCRMCTASTDFDVCSTALGADYACVTGFSFDATSTGKTYACSLSSDLQALFPNGSIDVTCDRNEQGTGSCLAAVYNAKDTVNGAHVIDCNMTECSFPTGSVNAKCGAINCHCGSQCSSMSKSIIESTFSGQPVEIQVMEATQVLTLVIENSPLPLSATCTASACERGGQRDRTISKAQSTPASTSERVHGVALAVMACIILALLFLVACFSFCCVCLDKRRNVDEADLETELLKVSSRVTNKLEFIKISCYGQKGPSTQDERMILNSISGSVVRGQVMGILGPSGSGKTTLLNAIAAMENGTSTITGELLLDGQNVTKDYRRLAAYVEQDDTLFPALTVRECITYSAQLRLPLEMTAAAKTAMVTRVLAELNLTPIMNSRIGAVGGSTSMRGISGGERRRVSIGMELVTSPQILLLDEPTSGLDSSSAYAVLQVIQALARHDRMVILSIHQPSGRSFLLLDQILLLRKGQLVYRGSPMESKPYFLDQGFACNEEDTAADFILDVASNAENVPVFQQCPENLKRVHENASLAKSSGLIPTELFSPKTPIGSPLYETSLRIADTSEGTSWGVLFQTIMLEIRVLSTRTALNLFRHRSLFIQHVTLSFVLALVTGLLFQNVSDNLAGFQNRMGAFFFILTFFGFASLSSMDLFISERPIFLRETGAKYYTAFSYFIAKTTLDTVLLRVVPASIFACIFYWLMALQAEASRFFLFWLTLVLFNIAAGSICGLVGVLSRQVGSANLAATVLLLLMLLFGGFLLNSATMPDSVAWLQHLSIFGYAFEILMTNELTGIILSFDAPGYPAIPVYGEVYLRTLGMEYTHRYYDIAALALGAIVLQVLAYGFLSLLVPTHRVMDEHSKKTT
ncbi:hypothetical protein CCR75_009034 [Bremia lactucae]|uniref:ABC transporter domain-containing protein n=1 Tax=Bremia lactucae TaxID=4779 RepID=A0A976FI70_BRELC|nr:hypothetical protein CCR75_009034 [Bremia lactucae]